MIVSRKTNSDPILKVVKSICRLAKEPVPACFSLLCMGLVCGTLASALSYRICTVPGCAGPNMATVVKRLPNGTIGIDLEDSVRTWFVS